ncbi:MAG: hypothetical protein QNJ40_07265 [Xanthomonadales bacterium]|nr:hypothetical protein [Xanthomonadales bacterium]
MQQNRHTFRIVGLVLWRGGLAFAAVAAIYYGAWQTLKNLVWPGPVKVAAALAITGAALFLVSLILERREDSKREGNLQD